MTGHFIQANRKLPATLYLRVNGESVTGEEVLLEGNGALTTLNIVGTIKNNVLSAEITKNNRPWSAWQGEFTAGKRVLNGTFKQNAGPGYGTFTFKLY